MKQREIQLHCFPVYHKKKKNIKKKRQKGKRKHQLMTSLLHALIEQARIVIAKELNANQTKREEGKEIQERDNIDHKAAPINQLSWYRPLSYLIFYRLKLYTPKNNIYRYYSGTTTQQR